MKAKSMRINCYKSIFKIELFDCVWTRREKCFQFQIVCCNFIKEKTLISGSVLSIEMCLIIHCVYRIGNFVFLNQIIISDIQVQVTVMKFTRKTQFYYLWSSWLPFSGSFTFKLSRRQQTNKQFAIWTKKPRNSQRIHMKITSGLLNPI